VFHSETETHPDAHNSEFQELAAAASGQSFIPTPMESLSLGETPREGDAANWQPDWGSGDVAGLLMGVHEMQIDNPTPSTSNDTGAGPGEQKNQKKKREEAGECRPCKKTFTRISDAKRHRQTVHKKGKDVCKQPECKLTFSRKDALRRHMLKQHNMQLDLEDQ
jgi:hypothetical protein